MRPGIIGVFVVILTCSGLPAVAASASPVAEEAPLGFTLRGTNGYSVSGIAYVDPIDGREEISISVSRGDDVANYVAPAKVTSESIHSDLGSLGRIDLVLHRSGKEKTTDVRCLPHSEGTYEAGTYEGIVEFDGEGGFTRARATRVNALPSVALTAKRFCRRRSSGESSGPNQPGARLAGSSYAHGRTLKFQVNKNRPSGATLFTATLVERHDGIRIHRELSGTAPVGAFRYSDHLRTAVLSPPAPFAGSATLRHSKNGTSPLFTGNLTAAFPGRSVRIAGPGVHVSLVHARLTFGNSPNSASVTSRLAQQIDLGSRAEDLRRLAVLSARLTPATDGESSSFTGGYPDSWESRKCDCSSSGRPAYSLG